MAPSTSFRLGATANGCATCGPTRAASTCWSAAAVPATSPRSSPTPTRPRSCGPTSCGGRPRSAPSSTASTTSPATTSCSPSPTSTRSSCSVAPDPSSSDGPARPASTQRSPRVVQVVATARQLLESEGRDGLTMRRLAEEIGIKAPSLYKHLPDKAALEAALVEEALAEVGAALHASLDDAGTLAPVDALLGTYRSYGTAHPNLYRDRKS